MVKKKGGLRRKTRYLFTKHFRRRGKISFTSFFNKFEIGESVFLTVEPAYQKGMYHPMFAGRKGVIRGKKGRCYEVEIKDGKKSKILITHPVHLKRAK